jgi:hypothetical protein
VNGAVEVGQNIVERQFESRLAFMHIQNLDQLNEAARDWQLAFNSSRIHSRHGHSRFALWSTIREEQLRIAPAPELCRDLVTTKPVEATVRGDLTVSYSIKQYGPNDYDVRFIPGLSPRDKISIVVNPFRAPAIDVVIADAQGTKTTYTVEPIRKNVAGFRFDAPVIGQTFAAAGDSNADRNRKDIRIAAYGVSADTDADMRKLRKAGAVPFDGQFNAMADVEQHDLPTWLPKRGTDLAVATVEREVAPLSHVAAAKELQARGVLWDRKYMAVLESRYPSGDVPQADLDALVTEFSASHGIQRVIAGARNHA